MSCTLIDYLCFYYQLQGQIKVKVLYLSVKGIFSSSAGWNNRAAYNAWINNTELTAAQSHWIMTMNSLSHLPPVEVVHNHYGLLETMFDSFLELKSRRVWTFNIGRNTCTVPQYWTHRTICATIEGPYQSPAFFPEPLPISTNWWIPNGVDSWSPNQLITFWWMGSACLSCTDSGLFFWLHLGPGSLGGWGLSELLEPRMEPKVGMGTPAALAGERGLNTSKSTSVNGWASGQVQSKNHKQVRICRKIDEH